MRKSIKPQNGTTLEALVTGDAKRQAESLGIPLAAFIGNLAADADTLPVTIRVRMGDIGRINSRVGGGRIHEWIEGVVDDALNGAGEDLGGNRIVLDLPAKTAAALREAAEFEEMSVSEYLLDGLNRDLDLSTDLMATAKN